MARRLLVKNRLANITLDRLICDPIIGWVSLYYVVRHNACWPNAFRPKGVEPSFVSFIVISKLTKVKLAKVGVLRYPDVRHFFFVADATDK
jgi:hypothetical protein